MKLPLDAPKFKLAAVSVPRNACEARERARDRVRVRRSATCKCRKTYFPSLSTERENTNSPREVGPICPNNRLVSDSTIRHEQLRRIEIF